MYQGERSVQHDQSRLYQGERLIQHDQSHMKVISGEKKKLITPEGYIREKDQSNILSHTCRLYQGEKISLAWPVTREAYIREKDQSSMTSHTWRLYQRERSVQCDQSRIHIIPGWNTSHQVTCWRNKLIEVQYTRPIPNNRKWPNMKY